MEPRAVLGFSLKLTYTMEVKFKKNKDNGSMTFTNEANNDPSKWLRVNNKTMKNSLVPLSLIKKFFFL